MRLDGERLVEHVAEAKNEVILCAPFIKEKVFRFLLNTIRPDVNLRVITRWLPHEIALGVSDLEVFQLIQDRENSFLGLMDELHAKMYVADEVCLIGSANLTSKALGWAKESNVELLFEVSRSAEEVQRLLTRLQYAREATYAEMESARVAADALREEISNEFLLRDTIMVDDPLKKWLPECAAPHLLYAVYARQEKNIEASVVDDAKSDMAALSIPEGLEEEEFRHYVASTIVEMGGVRDIVNEIPSKISDEKGAYLVGSMRSSFDKQAIDKQWQIIREWVDFFLSSSYEVAPESYVIRLRSRY